MNNKQHLYTVRWTQPYDEWTDILDALEELALDLSGYVEANQVINNIKGKLND